jgi:hypothetical protein
MASLGTLAAELKLEGAAAMISGLRGASAAVSVLGQTLVGVRTPLAQVGAVRIPAVGRPLRLPGVVPISAGGAPAQPRGPSGLPGSAPIPAGGAPALQSDPPQINPVNLSAVAAQAGAVVRTVAAAFRQGGEIIRASLKQAPRLGQTRIGGPPIRGEHPAAERAQPAARPTGPARGEAAGFPPGMRVDSAPPPRLPAAAERASGRAGPALAALLGQLRAAAAAPPRAAGRPPLRLDAGVGAGRMAEGDRLARVGGFIGNGGGPALDYHRRTAAATEKSAQTLQALVQRWASPSAAPAPARWS